MQLSIVAQRTENTQPNYFAHIHPKHAKILKKWLKKYPWLRPATEADADHSFLEMMREINAKTYFPYYIVGDFNKDNYKDFAVLLVNKKQTSKGGFALIVFNGQPEQDMYMAYYESNLEQIEISYMNIENHRLLLAKSETDTQCFYLVPKGRKYIYKDCSD